MKNDTCTVIHMEF